MFLSIFIGHLFFPSDMPVWLSQVQTYGIFAAGYLIRPFGGIVMAHFGDKFGRKKMFTLSLLLMALPTLLIGCLPTYQSAGIIAPLLLLLMRLCQGLAVGGEVPGAWTFVAEHVPHHRVGIACGILTAGLSLGILLGSLVSVMVTRYFSAESMLTIGWRLPFILGGIFGFIAMFLRRWLKETPVFLEMQKQRQHEKDRAIPVMVVIAKYLPQTIISMLLTWVLSAGIMVVILMTPNYLQTQFNISSQVALEANALAIIGLIVGCIVYGGLADKISIGKIISWGCALAVLAIAAFYTSLQYRPELLWVTYILAGFTVGVVGSFAYFMVRCYPASVRYSGVSFSFNVAYAIAGGLTPLLIALLTHFATGFAAAYYVVALFGIGILLGILLIYKAKKLTATEMQ
ncbi:MFS transporter [Utexia brackfieldae]|uniref:MFS transporter n=1 Tax=Utexia brackfieldae TaxID=3074108 RepID=UPI00370CFFFB